MSDFDRLIDIATDLVEVDRIRMHYLVERRKASGLSRGDIARMLDWSVDYVKEFEAYWSDPRLSQIRRYELCIAGAEEGLDVESG